ncbi:MAG: MBL fold metallo-hydrolase [Eubacteriales bacterium]|nr:MBL fold metallo-hydrolase [Eubacteriales bacterium]
MELQVLGTGSSGNCYALYDEQQIVLLDAGIPAKRILRGIDHRVGDVAGCLITHEHQDHCRGARDLYKLGVPMLGTTGTKEALPYIDNNRSMHQRRLGNFSIMDFPVIHDTKEPCGWLLGNTRTGERMLYATDTSGLLFAFPHINYWLIECNYAEELIWDTAPSHRERIRQYHMSMETLATILTRNDLTDCKQIILCHMSRERGDLKLMTRFIAGRTGKPTVMAVEGARIPLNAEPF